MQLNLDLSHDQIKQLQFCNIPGHVNIQGCLQAALELSHTLLNGEISTLESQLLTIMLKLNDNL